jgi:hypothetical protein
MRKALDTQVLLRWLRVLTIAVTLVAVADLGVRAILRLDWSWDGFAYHLPFAALRAGIPIPFDMPLQFLPSYAGFPPLGDLVQGLLWRAFGTVTVAQLANYLAFVLYLAYCHVVLKARFWHVALIALTAPLVIIHTTVLYIDLFAGVMLAIGVSSAIYLLLFPERGSRGALVGGLLGLVAACWTKFTVVPIAAPFFLVFLILAIRTRVALRLGPPRVALLFALAITVAAAPYVRNLVLYDNPLWPVRVPIAGDLFPYISDSETQGIQLNRPPALRDAPQWLVTVRSFLEVDVPTRYSWPRQRWVIDQYDGPPGTGEGMRMGGFWNVGVVVYLTAMLGALLAVGGRPGRIAALGTILTLGLVAILPQSNELRYFMFIPLVWAAVIAMLLPRLEARWPRGGLAFGVVVLVLFAMMVRANRTSFDPRPVSWSEIAARRGVAALWPQLTPGHAYCVVGTNGTALLYTGPTLSEFTIYGRDLENQCPDGMPVVTRAGIQPSASHAP